MKSIQMCLTSFVLTALAAGWTVAWAQEKAPPPESGPEVVEIVRPTPIERVSTEYLGQIVTARQAPQLTSVVQKAMLEQSIDRLRLGDLEAAREAWSVCISNFPEGSTPSTAEYFIQYILNLSYLQPTPGLLIYAEKVRFFNEQTGIVEEHIAGLRKHESVFSESEIADTNIENLILAPYVPGGTAVRSREPERVLRKDLASRIETWERTLDTIHEDANLANSELRSSMARERAVVRAITVASKMLHEVSERIGQESP